MTRLPPHEELLAVARRVVWFKPPEETLADVPFFVAHLLTYSTPEDVKTVGRYFTADQLRSALDAAPPGVFDARSWNYWNLMLGRNPAPPRPARVIPDGPSVAPEESRGARRKSART